MQRDVVRGYTCRGDSYVSSDDIHSKKTRRTVHIIVNFSQLLTKCERFYPELDEKYR
jgi:hypothetical protein